MKWNTGNCKMARYVPTTLAWTLALIAGCGPGVQRDSYSARLLTSAQKECYYACRGGPDTGLVCFEKCGGVSVDTTVVDDAHLDAGTIDPGPTPDAGSVDAIPCKKVISVLDVKCNAECMVRTNDKDKCFTSCQVTQCDPCQTEVVGQRDPKCYDECVLRTGEKEKCNHSCTTPVCVDAGVAPEPPSGPVNTSACQALAIDWQKAISAAQICDPLAKDPQCATLVPQFLGCAASCEVAVNDTTPLQRLITDFVKANCQKYPSPCPVNACSKPTGKFCSAKGRCEVL